MRANTDRAPGVRLITDAPGRVDVPPVSPGEPVEPPFVFEDEPYGPDDIVALRGRITAGLGVQLLWHRVLQHTFVTLTLDGETETFPVPPEHANDAFEHPFAYGGTLL